MTNKVIQLGGRPAGQICIEVCTPGTSAPELLARDQHACGKEILCMALYFTRQSRATSVHPWAATANTSRAKTLLMQVSEQAAMRLLGRSCVMAYKQGVALYATAARNPQYQRETDAMMPMRDQAHMPAEPELQCQ